MTGILTADWHLTDRPQDEYRWDVFKWLTSALNEHYPFPCPVYILGDIVDKKDKHSAELTNRLVRELGALAEECGDMVHILMGNHDKPLKGVPFWSFLDSTSESINYVTHPMKTKEGAWLLPFTTDPERDWKDLDFDPKNCKAVMLHQPVDGVMMENGRRLSGYRLPTFPRGIKIYAGDIHDPQTVGRVQYVGAPHHINFGDRYKCRMLVVDDKFAINREMILTPRDKALVEVSDLSELKGLGIKAGDQVKVRFSLPDTALGEWPSTEAAISAWAAKAGVHVSSVEAVIQEEGSRVVSDYSGETDPVDILAAFADAEGMDEARMLVGADILAEVMSNGR